MVAYVTNAISLLHITAFYNKISLQNFFFHGGDEHIQARKKVHLCHIPAVVNFINRLLFG